MFTLWHIKLTIYIKKNKFISHKQYSFGLSSLEIQGKVIQTNFIASSFTLSEKKMTPKPSKLATAKTFFSSVYAIVTSCLDKCFLFHVVTGRHCSL